MRVPDWYPTVGAVGLRCAIERVNQAIHVLIVMGGRMTDRTDRLLSVLVVLVALLLVAQATVVPRNRLLSRIGIIVAAIAIVYSLIQIADTF